VWDRVESFTVPEAPADAESRPALELLQLQEAARRAARPEAGPPPPALMPPRCSPRWLAPASIFPRRGSGLHRHPESPDPSS